MELHRARVIGSPWPTLHGTDIVSARHYPRHAHDTYGFGLMREGAQRSASGRGSVDAHAGALITTNPGEVHDGRPLGGPTRHWRMVYIAPAALDAFAAEAGPTASAGALALTRPVFDDVPLRGALVQLFDRLDAWHRTPERMRDDTAALACEEALVLTLTPLLSRHGSTAMQPVIADGLVERARQRLGDTLDAAPTLAELAQLTGLSRYQLLRRYAAVYGVPPHAWLLQRRAERAHALIRNGAALADAAATCGYADQSHLTRAFARHFGYTPGALQAAISFKTAR